MIRISPPANMSFLSNVVGGNGDGTATFFEMAMVYQGDLSLYPAFSQVVQTVRDNFPGSRSAHMAHAASRELFAALRFLGESYFLSQHSASAFEMLYGLRRANTKPIRKRRPQDVRFGYDKRVASLFELVFFPYFATKMDEMYERAKSRRHVAVLEEEEDSDASLNHSGQVQVDQKGEMLKRVSHQLRAKFVRAYPLLRKCMNVLHAAYQLVFALGKSRFFSPWQHLCGYGVIRPRPSPLPGDRMALGTITLPKKTLVEKLTYWGTTGAYYGVIASVVAFKFFEWWYSTDVQMIAQVSSEEPTTPPPPTQPGRSHMAVVALPRKESLCGICGDPCTNIAASPSGYIYCYPCIFAYVKEHGLTPKGGLPCTVHAVRKIWLS